MDYARAYKKTTKKGFGGFNTSSTTTESIDYTNVKGDLQAQQDIASRSGANTNIIASDLGAGGNLSITAGSYIDDARHRAD